MRVCIVTVAGYVHGIGGMQAHTSDLASGLVADGHEVEVITARHPDGVSSEEFQGALWHFLPVRTRYRHAPMRHHSWLIASREQFARLHAQRPFDIVHSESTNALGLLRAGVQRRIPVAVKFHGNYLGLAQAALRRAIRARSFEMRFREAKHLVWISGQHFGLPDAVYRFRECEAMVPSQQQLAGTQRSYLLRGDRLHVVPNGIDPERFRPLPCFEVRRELGLPDKPLLVCVGRLNREKGFHVAIAALARLREGSSDAELVIVGDGEERNSLERLTGALGVEDRVHFTGTQPQERVALFQAAADVFLFPTEREEAAPLVLPQAMACGVPVVASDIGGITEVVDRPGENGVLVAPGDVTSLTGAVEELLGDPARRERMGAAARSRIVREYTVERMVERTLRVYALARSRLAGA